jgi:hypothetical protein
MAGERFFYNVSLSLGGYAAKDKIGSDPFLNPAVLNQFGGFNPSASNNYIQVFDTVPSLPNPGDEPILSFFVPSMASFSWVDPLAGLRFSFGVVWAVSTTGDVFTASADAWWVFAQGRFI